MKKTDLVFKVLKTLTIVVILGAFSGSVASSTGHHSVDNKYPNGPIVQNESTNTSQVEVFIAPKGDFDQINSIKSINRGRENGRITKSKGIAKGDVLILKFYDPGLSNKTNTVSDEDSLENASLYAVEVNPGPSLPKKKMWMNSSSSKIIKNHAVDSFFIVYNTSNPNLTWIGEGREYKSIRPEIENNDIFIPRLFIDGENEINPDYSGIAPKGENLTGKFTFWDRRAQLEIQNNSNTYPLQISSNPIISGETPLAPGTRIKIQIDATNTVYKNISKNVTVFRDHDVESRQNNSLFAFAAKFNLSKMAGGTNLTIRTIDDGEVLGELTSVIKHEDKTTRSTPETDQGVTEATTINDAKTTTSVDNNQSTKSDRRTETTRQPRDQTPTISPSSTPEIGPGFGPLVVVVALLILLLLIKNS
ncbi:hypothetical protein [Halosimplex halobium]|uniref:hypothetical protein n=1 Tax=Halosimplex halobium TaxID=3396618 RepID=UPI003F55C9CB